ncbi:MAG: RNA methyltransferase [Pseudomonadota bacterium]
MSGTNRTLDVIKGGPVIILVNPQLGENIGMVARAMANFGLSELRLVDPRDGWPNEKANAAASRADHVIDATKVFSTLGEAISDLNYVLATTARKRDMLKPVLAPDEAMKAAKSNMAVGSQVGILFGRERWGLENDEIAMADEIVTFPVNPGFASLNIAQAVLLMSYEWMRLEVGEGETNFRAPQSVPASRESLISLLQHLESALDDAKYFFPPEKREKMLLNIHNTFVHAGFREQEIHVLHGIVAALERRWKKRRTR